MTPHGELRESTFAVLVNFTHSSSGMAHYHGWILITIYNLGWYTLAKRKIELSFRVT
jgi:hypothetical protein